MSINIRSIQHYMYCPRRYALLEINQDWEENVFVVKANIMHENVHAGIHEYNGNNKKSLSSVTVYNDELDIFGITDCIEFIKDNNGSVINGWNGKYRINIVEYKPKQPKDGIRETDAIQVFAQKLCVDYIWNCMSKGYIYYSDTKKRVELPFEKEYDRYYNLIIKLLQEMRDLKERHTIPDKAKGQNCSGCSIKDVCMPIKRKYSVKQQVLDELMI